MKKTACLKLCVLNEEGGNRKGWRNPGGKRRRQAGLLAGPEGIFFVQPNKQDKPNKRIRLTGQAGRGTVRGLKFEVRGFRIFELRPSAFTPHGQPPLPRYPL